MATVGDNIKQLRKRAGLTQIDLSKKTGLSIGSIQGYEQGKYKPKIESIQKIADALDLSFYDIVGENSSYGPPKFLTTLAQRSPYGVIESADEKELLTKYNRLNEKGKDKIQEYADDLCINPKYTSNDADDKKEA